MGLIQKEYLYNINLEDEFFNSLRESYFEFDEWFKKNENREAYITKTKEGKITAFLLLKQENEKEDYSCFEKPFKSANRLKICTFKVTDTGKGIGNEFIKIIIHEAKQKNVDEIYATIFEEQEALINFLKRYNFRFYTYKNTYKSDKSFQKEAVYVKNMKIEQNKGSILISINPPFVEKIFNGTKKYEYRKTKGKREINKMLIYSTYPVKKVVGEAEIEEVLEGLPEKIWEKTKQYSGVEYKFYKEYFKEKNKAIAYKLKNVKKYDIPKELSNYGIKSAPQSFVYVD